MSKSSPQVPTPADPTKVATQQTISNVGTAASQQAGNLVNQVGPNGSTTYDQTGSYTDPTTGAVTPRYTQTNSLDPLSQAILQGTKQVGSSLLPTAQKLATQAGTSATTPLNFDTPQSGILNTAPQQLNDQAADAVYRKQSTYLDPQFTQSERDLHDQLSRQGIPVGSEAYNSAMTNFNNTKNQAYGAARDSATAGGADSATKLFNMALQGRNQNIGEQQLAQTNPLQLLGQIFNGANA